MCKTSDLVVMVVDSSDEELNKTCESLGKLGITKIVCTKTYNDAIETIKTSPDIDIVIADFDIEVNKSLGLLLCSSMRQKHPSIYFVLISKRFSCSVIMESLPLVDDILNKNSDNDVEELMQKWVNLARYRNEVKELLYGKPER